MKKIVTKWKLSPTCPLVTKKKNEELELVAPDFVFKEKKQEKEKIKIYKKKKSSKENELF